MSNKLLVVGASGLLGRAVLKHFKNKPNWRCIGLSRRTHNIRGIPHLKSDLLDRNSIESHSDALSGVTHILYTALYEMDDLLLGWRHNQQIQINTTMFQNLIEHMVVKAPDLTHVSILQGTKAYGIHVEPMKAPAKESWPRHNHDNFYWNQEDILKRLAKKGRWSFNIWRPQVVFGTAVGSPMNLAAAVATYITICKESKKPCFYPGGNPIVTEATDAGLFSEALEWSFKEPVAKNQTYNITNGDVLIWPHLWPEICDYFKVPVGKNKIQNLSSTMPKMEGAWASIVEKYNLKQLTLKELVGGSWQFLDRALRDAGTAPAPSLVSTIKLRKAGFNGCIDTSDSIKRCFKEMQQEHLIPLEMN